MENRWLILAVLFVVRTAMGFQYQSVGSVSSFLVEDLGINYAQLLPDNPAAPLLFGGTLLFITIIILGLFRAFQRRTGGMAS